MAYIRQNQDILKGDELWLFVGTSATTKPICFSTSSQLSRSMSTTSVSSKDHGNTSYTVPGEGTWTCSTEALMSIEAGQGSNALAFQELMDIFDSDDPTVYVTFGKLSNYTAKGIVDVDVAGSDQANGWEIGYPKWEGKGYITSLQASGGHGDSATMSIEITGNGPLEKKTNQ